MKAIPPISSGLVEFDVAMGNRGAMSAAHCQLQALIDSRSGASIFRQDLTYSKFCSHSLSGAIPPPK